MKLTTTAGIALALTAALTLGRSYFRGPSSTYSVSSTKGAQSGHKMYILITGGTKGIGAKLVQSLASPYTEIIFTGRSQSLPLALELKKSIESKVPDSSIHFHPVDFSSLSEVKKFAEEVEKKWPNLDIQIHNAGAYGQEKGTTEDGLDKAVQQNYFSHFYLSDQLWGLMTRKSGMGSYGFRVISTSSIAHARCGDWGKEGILEDLNWTRREWDADKNYAETKFENILFSRGLNLFHKQESAQVESDGGLRDLRSVSLHPGVVDTPFFANHSVMNSWYTPLIRPFWWYFTKTESDGAQTTLDLAVKPWGRLEKGAYHKDCAVAEARKDAGDKVLIKGLWNKTIDLFAERNIELKSFKKLDQVFNV